MVNTDIFNTPDISEIWKNKMINCGISEENIKRLLAYSSNIVDVFSRMQEKCIDDEDFKSIIEEFPQGEELILAFFISTGLEEAADLYNLIDWNTILLFPHLPEKPNPFQVSIFREIIKNRTVLERVKKEKLLNTDQIRNFLLNSENIPWITRLFFCMNIFEEKADIFQLLDLDDEFDISLNQIYSFLKKYFKYDIESDLYCFPEFNEYIHGADTLSTFYTGHFYLYFNRENLSDKIAEKIMNDPFNFSEESILSFITKLYEEGDIDKTNMDNFIRSIRSCISFWEKNNIEKESVDYSYFLENIDTFIEDDSNRKEMEELIFQIIDDSIDDPTFGMLYTFPIIDFKLSGYPDSFDTLIIFTYLKKIFEQREEAEYYFVLLFYCMSLENTFFYKNKECIRKIVESAIKILSNDDMNYILDFMFDKENEEDEINFEYQRMVLIEYAYHIVETNSIISNMQPHIELFSELLEKNPFSILLDDFHFHLALSKAFKLINNQALSDFITEFSDKTAILIENLKIDILIIKAILEEKRESTFDRICGIILESDKVDISELSIKIAEVIYFTQVKTTIYRDCPHLTSPETMFIHTNQHYPDFPKKNNNCKELWSLVHKLDTIVVLQALYDYFLLNNLAYNQSTQTYSFRPFYNYIDDYFINLLIVIDNILSLGENENSENIYNYYGWLAGIRCNPQYLEAYVRLWHFAEALHNNQPDSDKIKSCYFLLTDIVSEIQNEVHMQVVPEEELTAVCTPAREYLDKLRGLTQQKALHKLIKPFCDFPKNRWPNLTLDYLWCPVLLLMKQKGVFYALKMLLLIFRKLTTCVVRYDLGMKITKNYPQEESDPWIRVPQLIHYILKDIEETGQGIKVRKQLAEYLVSLLKPRDKTKEIEIPANLDDDWKKGWNPNCTEMHPIWRFAYIEAVVDLGVNPKGKLFYVLQHIETKDPAEFVRESARRAVKKIKSLKSGVKEGSNKRYLLNAWWQLRKAHFLTLGKEDLHNDDAVIQRSKEVREN